MNDTDSQHSYPEHSRQRRRGPVERMLEGLNDPQRQAVTYGDGPLLIFAGAGSGKTRVLTHRAAYLIHARGVSPGNILAVTFTNKAANEMKQRIARLLGEMRWDMWVGTFHAVCARILRSDSGRLGMDPAFVVFDEADQLLLMKDCLRDLEISPDVLQPWPALNEIGRAKNELISPRNYQQHAVTPFEQNVARAYQLYQTRLAENKAVDFDDLIMNVVTLFEQQSDDHELHDWGKRCRQRAGAGLRLLRPGSSQQRCHRQLHPLEWWRRNLQQRRVRNRRHLQRRVRRLVRHGQH